MPRVGAIGLVYFYRIFLSPVLHLFGGGCRFHPTCSEYAIQALRKHGLMLAFPMIIWRLLRCQPWGGCGYDPVPENWHAFLHPSERERRTHDKDSCGHISH
ncbi:MAG: membrane protein insertion efficiency factor YidD [Opitutales bacterium]|nr:membrane protein insertion efficiency factor YidD [Opitutales bacterium]